LKIEWEACEKIFRWPGREICPLSNCMPPVTPGVDQVIWNGKTVGPKPEPGPMVWGISPKGRNGGRENFRGSFRGDDVVSD
jgi:hypothetical protein